MSAPGSYGCLTGLCAVERLAADILAKEQRIIEIMGEIKALLATGPDG